MFAINVDKKFGSSKKKKMVDSSKDFKHKLRDHFGIQLNYKPPAYESWLDPANQNVVELGIILKNEIVTELVSNPVSKQVNSTRNNDSFCIEPN